MRYQPTMYQKDIFSIPYESLQERGIRCLVFDLDNTLALVDEAKCPKRSQEWIEKLKKDFTVFVLSNNSKKRLLPYQEDLGIEGIAWALKPFPRGLRKIARKYHFKKDEMVMIGDQLMTDIRSGNAFGIMTILVDPLGTKEAKITGINRFLEKRVKKKIHFKKGAYYE